MINSYCQNSSTASTEEGGGAALPYTSSQHRSPQRTTSHERSPPRYTHYPHATHARYSAGEGYDEDRYQQAPSSTPVAWNPSPSHTRVAADAVGYRRDAVDSPSVREGNSATHPLAHNPPIIQEEKVRHSFAASLRLHGGAAARECRNVTTAASTPAEALFEMVLPVSTRLNAQEPQRRQLGLYVRAGRGGPNGVSRLVLVRLTDPTDPFFLFELELLEDDYGAFKQRLELLVDFNGFPRYLVSMLRGIADGVSPCALSFALNTGASSATSSSSPSDTGRGTLRVLEATEFRTVEHISLALLRQGDAGLKRFLAERFQFYEHAYREAERARIGNGEEMLAQVRQLQRECADLRDSLRKTEEDGRLSASDAEKQQLAALNQLREQQNKELNSLRESYEKRLETHSRALEEKTQQVQELTKDKTETVAKLRARVSELEATLASLESQQRSAQDTSHLQSRELETLRSLNDDLVNFKAEATKAMSENELNYVTVTERLRGTAAALQKSEEKVAALQLHDGKQGDYLRLLADQNTQQADRLRESEKSLEKAHHIIANQLQSLKHIKERYHIATEQLRTQEAQIQEKENAFRRQQEGLSTSTERVQELLRRNNDLRDQLEKTNQAREQLMLEVKQTQQALLRLQQSTSVNGRHWGLLSSNYHSAMNTAPTRGINSTTASPGATIRSGRYGAVQSVPADLLREFGANAQVHPQLNYTGRTSSASPVPTLFTNSRPNAISASSSPALQSQCRAESKESAGLSDRQHRSNSSSNSGAASLGKLEGASMPSASHEKVGTDGGAVARRAVRPLYNDLAVRSFLSNHEASPPASTAVAVGVSSESAYF